MKGSRLASSRLYINWQCSPHNLSSPFFTWFCDLHFILHARVRKCFCSETFLIVSIFLSAAALLICGHSLSDSLLWKYNVPSGSSSLFYFFLCFCRNCVCPSLLEFSSTRSLLYKSLVTGYYNFHAVITKRSLFQVSGHRLLQLLCCDKQEKPVVQVSGHRLLQLSRSDY
jgi:hypothetical protein